MNTLNTISTRYSCRSYTGEAVGYATNLEGTPHQPDMSKIRYII